MCTTPVYTYGKTQASRGSHKDMLHDSLSNALIPSVLCRLKNATIFVYASYRFFIRYGSKPIHYDNDCLLVIIMAINLNQCTATINSVFYDISLVIIFHVYNGCQPNYSTLINLHEDDGHLNCAPVGVYNVVSMSQQTISR